MLINLGLLGECIGVLTDESTHFNSDGSITGAWINVTACNQNERVHEGNIVWKLLFLPKNAPHAVLTLLPAPVSSSAVSTVPLFSTF